MRHPHTFSLTSQMAGNMVSLCTGDIASFPLASQAEVVGRLTTDVRIAEVMVEIFRVFKRLVAALPSTGDEFHLFAAVVRR